MAGDPMVSGTGYDGDLTSTDASLVVVVSNCGYDLTHAGGVEVVKYVAEVTRYVGKGSWEYLERMVVRVYDQVSGVVRYNRRVLGWVDRRDRQKRSREYYRERL